MWWLYLASRTASCDLWKLCADSSWAWDSSILGPQPSKRWGREWQHHLCTRCLWTCFMGC
jgi:hypothetical protein